jgi:phosphoenolpyruvate-protein kinase (PTS system EI component)
LQDPALLESVGRQIREERRNAEAAWQAAIEETASRFRRSTTTTCGRARPMLWTWAGAFWAISSTRR